MESPVRILSSAGIDRQCHICGTAYSKAALPTHQRSCIKKRFKKRSVMSAGMVGEIALIPCVTCMTRIPQHKMMEHLKFCKRFDLTQEMNDLNFSTQILSLKPSNGKIKKSLRSVKTAGQSRNYPVPVAAEEYDQEFQIKDSQEIPESSNKSPNLPCSNCNRKFLEQDRLDKHIKICLNSKKPRKVFDMTKARVSGTDMEKYALSPTKPDKKIIAAMNKKANWRDRHESFINAIRAARQPNAPPPPPDINPDYVSCPHCKRRFNADSGARHIPLCNQDPNKISNKHVNSSKSSPQHSKGSLALKKRTAYKPPLPKSNTK